MRTILIVFCLFSLATSALGQMNITDKHITNQQERMVFKQWDEDKFTPTPGFLWLNPEYWMTWALHPNYPKTDLRPLGPTGPQTQRMMLAVAMDNTDYRYKLHSDTLRNTALSEAVNYSSALSLADPLWLMYYSKEFTGLTDGQDADLLVGLSTAERQYIISSGLYNWFKEESKALLERLEAAKTTTLDRGSRIMAYHRMLAEYRKLLATWETKKSRAKTYLAIKSSKEKIRSGESFKPVGGKNDIQIANDILSKSKL